MEKKNINKREEPVGVCVSVLYYATTTAFVFLSFYSVSQFHQARHPTRNGGISSSSSDFPIELKIRVFR